MFFMLVTSQITDLGKTMFAKKPKGVESNTQKRLIPAWIWMIVGSLLTLTFVAFLYLLQPFKSTSDEKEPLDGLTAKTQSTQTETDDIKSDGIKSEQPNNGHANKTKLNTSDGYEFYDLLPEQEVTPIPDDVVVLQPDNEKKVTNTKADVTIAPKNKPKPVQKTQPKISETTQVKTQKADNPKADTDNQKVSSEKPQTDATSDVQVDTDSNDPIEQIIEEETSFILQINSYGTAEEADRRRAEVLLAGIDAQVLKSTMGDGAVLYQVVSKAYDSKKHVFLAQERLKASGIDALVVERRL